MYEIVKKIKVLNQNKFTEHFNNLNFAFKLI